jgi:hypothetical protein
MAYVVDFKDVSTKGLETSPVAAALAGLRANEARYFMTKYQHAFTTEPAKKSKDAVDYVHRILNPSYSPPRPPGGRVRRPSPGITHSEVVVTSGRPRT